MNNSRIHIIEGDNDSIIVYENGQIRWIGNKDLTIGTVYFHDKNKNEFESYIEVFPMPSNFLQYRINMSSTQDDIYPPKRFEKVSMPLTINGKMKNYETRTVTPESVINRRNSPGFTISLNTLTTNQNNRFFEYDIESREELLRPMHLVFARIIMSEEFANVRRTISYTYDNDNHNYRSNLSYKSYRYVFRLTQ